MIEIENKNNAAYAVSRPKSLQIKYKNHMKNQFNNY